MADVSDRETLFKQWLKERGNPKWEPAIMIPVKAAFYAALSSRPDVVEEIECPFCSDAAKEKGIPVEVYTAMLGLTDSGLEKLKRGDMIISSHFARLLSRHIGSSKDFWMNREIQYRESRNRLDAERIATLESQQASTVVTDVAECAWVQDDEEWITYDTGCGNKYYLSDGTPRQNGMNFCCFCGGSLSAGQ